MSSRLVAFACLAAPLLLQPRPAEAQTDSATRRAELTSEATIFFAEVLPQLNLGRAACGMGAEWDEYPVAAEWLGVTAHAQLVAPSHDIQPAEVLDPDGRDAGWLCSEAETDALVLATARGLAAQPGVRRAELRGHELSFPVFSETFDRAVFVLTDWRIALLPVVESEPRIVSLMDGGGTALVYERRDNHWMRVASHDLFAWDGGDPSVDLSTSDDPL